MEPTETDILRDAQAEAIADWGVPDMGKLARLAGITQPTLVANGDNDIMVPTPNSRLLADHPRSSPPRSTPSWSDGRELRG